MTEKNGVGFVEWKHQWMMMFSNCILCDFALLALVLIIFIADINLLIKVISAGISSMEKSLLTDRTVKG
jgi:hypothetical protein